MSGEFRTRIQVAPQAYKTLPMDGANAAELAEAMAEVRDAVEFENHERALFKSGLVHLTAVQFAVDRRRQMQERAMEMFRIILEGIPEYMREHPYAPPTGGKRSHKAQVTT